MAILAAANPRFLRLRPIEAILICSFFVSGTCGLIHEVAWTRLLRLVIGNTTYSVTTVLCAFMGGLALGSYFGGRIIDHRKDLLRIFALLEIGIGIYCLFLPLIIKGVEPVFRILYQSSYYSSTVFMFVQFLIAGFLLLVPAVSMGMTLPLLTRFLAKSPKHIGWSVGTLYGVNTFGAVLGVTLSGFVLIPAFGVSRTIYTACTLNLLVGISAYICHRCRLKVNGCVVETHRGPADGRETGALDKQKESVELHSEDVEHFKVDRARLLLGCGLAGASALIYEIAWTRTLSLIIGSTAYAFSLMLTAFVMGLAVGSLGFARFVDRVTDPMRTLVVLQAGIGFSALLVMPLAGNLPFLATDLISRFLDSFWMLQLAEFGLILLIMFLPTTLMGAAFPVASRLFNQGRNSVGRSVGTIYGSSTLGNIAGAFLGGFVLIPFIGIQFSILFAVIINIAVAILFVTGIRSMSSVIRWSSIAFLSVFLTAGVWAIPKWDASRMSFGPFHEAARITKDTARSRSALEALATDSEVIFHREGPATTVTVKQVTEDVRALYINGKPDASSYSDLPTQELVAHLPLLFHPSPNDVLVIGLASGISLGSASLHPVETIDCVEISPSMLQACRYFDEYNYRVLDDPRVNVIVADGRNHLSLTGKKYDVIISQPSNPYFAGIADLYTREFFEISKDRLTCEGVMCTWVQAYHMDLATFRSIVRTFQFVFPNTSLWRVGKTDCILVGTRGESILDSKVLEERFGNERLKKDLARIGISDLPEIFSHYLMDSRAVGDFSRGARLHTDDNALVEFSAPRSLTRSAYDWNLIEGLEKHRDSALSILNASLVEARNITGWKRQAADFAKARGCVFNAHILMARGQFNGVAEELRAAIELNSSDKMLREFNDASHREAFLLVKEGNEDEAISLYRRMLGLLPVDERAHYNLATLLKRRKDYVAALNHYRMAAQLRPDYVTAIYNVGEVSGFLGDTASAKLHYRNALKLESEMIPALNNLARLLLAEEDSPEKQVGEAIHLAERACDLNGYRDLRLLDTLSYSYIRGAELLKAREITNRAMQIARAAGNQSALESLERRLAEITELLGAAEGQ